MNDHDIAQLNGDCQRFQTLIETNLVDECEFSDMDAAFVTDHKQSCSECGLYAAMLDTIELFGAEPETAAVDDEVRALVQTAFSTRERRRKRVAFAIAAAAVVAAAFAFVFYSSVRVDQSPQFDLVLGSISHNGQTFQQGNHFHLNDKVASPTTQDALIQIANTVYIAVEQDAQIRLLDSDERSLKVALDKGRMAVHLIPDAPMDLSVVLPWGTVDVTGTIFVVDASKDAGRVDVIKGSVAIQSRKSGHRRRHLKAGWRLGVNRGERSRRRVTQPDPLLALLGVKETPEPVDQVALGTTEVRHSKRKSIRTSTQVSPQPKPSLEALLQEARECRLTADWDCAVTKYRKAVALYPTRSDAATAMVSAGQILLEKQHAPQEALGFFKRYQKRRPDGGLGREALFGECASLKALGRQSQERACLEKYLEKYPGTLYSKMARTRLMSLSTNINEN